MEDKFFTQKFCDRCGKPLDDGRIMSMFNTDCLCMYCSDAERERPDFNEARKADEDQILKSNYNFKGIWLSKNPTQKP